MPTTRTWRGDAPPIAQVIAFTITAYDATTTYNVTRNGKTVSALGSGGTVTTAAAALVVVLNASTIPEFAEATWSNVAGAISGTAKTAGVPFGTFTTSVTGGTGTIGAVSTTTTSQGPNDVNVAANYAPSGVPASSDTLNLSNSASSLLYNLGSLSAVTLTALNQDTTFTGSIGLPRNNPAGYVEDRQRYLQVSATTANLGTLPGAGQGTGLIQLDLGSVTATVNVYSAGQPSQTGLPAIILKGTSASNVLNAFAGMIGSAIDAGDVSTWATITVAAPPLGQQGVTLTLGSGCTLTTITMDGGTVNLNASATTVTNNGGVLNVYGAAAITTCDCELGATLNLLSTGTIGTLTTNASTLDASQDPRTKTITTWTVYAGSTVNDPDKTITGGGGFVMVTKCDLNALKAIDIGSNFTLTRT